MADALFKGIKSHDELINYLKSYGKNNGDFEEYDFGWMVSLFLACLDNIRQHALPIEIEDFGEYLNEEQKQFLIKLSLALQSED